MRLLVLFVAVGFSCSLQREAEIFDGLSQNIVTEIKEIFSDETRSAQEKSKKVITWLKKHEENEVDLNNVVIKYLKYLNDKTREKRKREKEAIEGLISASNRVEAILLAEQTPENKKTEIKRLFSEEFTDQESHLLRALYPSLRRTYHSLSHFHMARNDFMEINGKKPIDLLASYVNKFNHIQLHAGLSKVDQNVRLTRLIQDLDPRIVDSLKIIFPEIKKK